MGPDGSLYVTEDFGERLVKLDANGVQQWTIGTAGVYGADNAHFGDLLERAGRRGPGCRW